MAKYACSEEGVQQLNLAANKITEGVETVKAETGTMRSVADDYYETIGPHKAQLNSALDAIAGAIELSTDPANCIADKLMAVAKKYEDIINDDPFASLDGGDSIGSSFSGSSGGGIQTAAGTVAIDAVGGGIGSMGTGAGGMSNFETSANTDELGVSVNGTYPDNYGSVISARHDLADENVRRVFDNYAEQIVIKTSNYPVDGVAFYDPSPENRGVYFNAEADINNPRGAGSTYFHEIGHMIDNASQDYVGNLSDNPEFYKALTEDVQGMIDMYNRMTPEQRDYANKYLFQDKCHSLSDLVDGISGGVLSGKYGHDRDYWNDRTKIPKEAFAHFFEASMGGGEKKQILSESFPRAMGIFNGMIESIIPKVKVLTKKL